MRRRLYLLFPERRHLERAVIDLARLGVPARHLHTVAREGIDLRGLPEASVRQREDVGARLEHLFWNLNLGMFFVAVAVAAIAASGNVWGLATAAMLVAAASFLAGNHFTRHIPHMHLAQFRDELRHGEYLLMVDVPPWQVAAITRDLRDRHPEVDIGGIGWMSEALHT